MSHSFTFSEFLGRRLLPLLGKVGLAVAGILVLGIAWDALALQLGPLRLPAPAAVWQAILDNWVNIPAMTYVTMQPAGLQDSLVDTTTNLLCSVAIGAVAGVSLGLLAQYSRMLNNIAVVIVTILGTVPLLMILPFLVQWFGNGGFVMSALVIAFAILTLAQVTVSSVGRAIANYRDYSRSMGAGPMLEMRLVILPALAPDLIAGLRIALAAGWGFQTMAEVVGGSNGIGRVIGVMAGVSNSTVILASVAVLGATALVLDALLVQAGKLLVRWKP